MFKIGVTVASTAVRRLIIMILHSLGKISYVKQGKINTNNQTFTHINSTFVVFIL